MGSVIDCLIRLCKRYNIVKFRRQSKDPSDSMYSLKKFITEFQTQSRYSRYASIT